MYRITTGADVMSDAAISCPYRGSAAALGAGGEHVQLDRRRSAVFGSVRTLAKSMSFQPTRKENTRTMTMPGIASGKMIRRSAPNRVHPSIIAASSKEIGIWRR